MPHTQICRIWVVEGMPNAADPMVGIMGLQTGRKGRGPGYKESDSRVSDGVYRDEAVGCGYTIFRGPIQAIRQYRCEFDDTR
jgi:hypothetical protein